ncbi:MAG: SWIM zinc finger family protein [Neisseria sp.]|nr:SWIM zinc finger family protein [Neisseria sp.]
MNLKRSADGWRAQVAGSGGRAYSVLLQLFGSGGIKQGYCDCPYHELCKHLAAVWYAVEEAETAEIIRDDRPSESRRGAQTGGDELLADLRSLLGSYARGCDYWQSQRLAERLWPLQVLADTLPDVERFGFLKTLYTRLNTIINRADDSDGLLGDCLFECMSSSEALHQQADAKLQAKIEKFWYAQMQDDDKHWITADTAADYWQAALCGKGRAAEVLVWLEGQ